VSTLLILTVRLGMPYKFPSAGRGADPLITGRNLGPGRVFLNIEIPIVHNLPNPSLPKGLVLGIDLRYRASGLV
jgi:hypothetical protein